MTKRAHSRLDTLLWAIAILTLTAIFAGAEISSRKIPHGLLQNTQSATSIGFLFWKSMHVAGFAALAFFLTLALCRKHSRVFADQATYLEVILIALCVSLLKEGAQHFANGRVPRSGDIVFDLVGIWLGMEAVWLIQVFLTRRQEQELAT